MRIEGMIIMHHAQINVLYDIFAYFTQHYCPDAIKELKR
jgi:hypothetical protein